MVTAQRREERLKDVPIAITAVSGQQLSKAGITSVTDLGLVTPGLNFAVQGAFAEPTIRGIGTSVTGAGADANVSLYLDGVYQPSQTANLFDLNNVQSVEVLKGPQGTLFGRNATGGAITITTLDPSFHPSADVSAGYGSFNEVRLNGYATGPISQDIAGDLAVQYKRDDGYIYNVNTGHEDANADTISLRSKLLFKPTDKLSFVLGGNYSNIQDSSPFSVKPVHNDNPFAETVNFPSNPYDIDLTDDPTIRTVSDGINLHAKYASDIGTFTSITSYERIVAYLNADIDNSPIFTSGAHIPSQEETVTQELNYASPQMGPFSWVGGVYFYWDNTGEHVTITSGAVPAPHIAADIIGRVRTDAEAAFAEGNYDFTDRLRLIAGVRYSTEEKRAGVDLSGVPGTNWSDRHRWFSVTPRGSLRYSLDPYSNVYLTISQGFKSGNYN
ncbi:MAG: TonB-dependent receptor, partial [Caulobacteraceae bacterium]|nr:TonB-dependent receptor [Caulobacteraceae bacterium]